MNISLSTNEKDRELLSKCICGDHKASEIFVRQFSDLVYRCVQHALMIKHLSLSHQDIEDLHNTVFLQLFESSCKKLRQYKGKNGCSIASWIRVVTVRIVLNHLRKKGLDAVSWQKKRIPLEDLPELEADRLEGRALLEKSEQERRIRDGIRELSPRDRLFLKLHFDKGMPITEVSEIMQLSVNTAYTVKHRAIQRLKTLVESTAES